MIEPYSISLSVFCLIVIAVHVSFSVGFKAGVKKECGVLDRWRPRDDIYNHYKKVISLFDLKKALAYGVHPDDLDFLAGADRDKVFKEYFEDFVARDDDTDIKYFMMLRETNRGKEEA